MFFVGIFGIQNKQKEIKFLEDIQCKDCNGRSGGKLIKTFNFFHFFFIPLFRWNEVYYVICEACHCVYEVPKEKGRRIENGEDSKITYWDLKAVEGASANCCNAPQNRCENCGAVVEEDFEYCPYCGHRLR